MKAGRPGVALALALSARAGFASAQATRYACPPVGVRTSIDASTSSPTQIRVPVVGSPDELCTLVLRRDDDGTGVGRAPVSRSYAGRNWERVAGRFSTSLVVDCDGGDGGGPECVLTLPPLDASGQEEYVLESFVRPPPSDAARAARFLEQAAFGPTRESVADLVSRGLDWESWVADQLDMEPGGFREFYRERVNPKFEAPHVAGAVGSGPCDRHSRWRTYALSSRDMLEEKKNPFSKYLIISQEAGIDGYAWRVDGQFRTVTTKLPRKVEAGARYRILNEKGQSWTGDCVGCPIYLSKYDPPLEGPQIKIDNPPVSFDAAVEAALSLDVIDLPAFGGGEELVPIESSAEYPLFGKWIKPNENAILAADSLATGRRRGGACDMDFRRAALWDASGAQPGTFPSAFGRSADGVAFLYDRHLTLYENTVENPLPDGGGQLVLDTVGTAAGTPVMCHNVRRNFYNEGHCVLSTLPTACDPDNKMPDEVIVLDGSTLEGIRALTGRDLYAVSGLGVPDVLNKNSGVGAPCGSGGRKKQQSRWIRDPSDGTCEDVASLGPKTRGLLRNFIADFVEAGNVNPGVVDVVREFSPCDAQDKNKAYLGKVSALDGSCWHHVHASELDIYDLTGADSDLYTVRGNMAMFDSAESFEAAVKDVHPVIGRLGDHVKIRDLSGGKKENNRPGKLKVPPPLDRRDVQDAYRTLEFNPLGRPVLMCGSPDEVASDPFHGDHGFDIVVPEKTGFRTRTRYELSGQKNTVWTHRALEAPDQLRQRMAWSLSQIVSVGLLKDRESAESEETENYLALYDMFVKNGLGDYRRLMQEFSFNVIMAKWLSFLDNRSLQYNLERDGRAGFPDENYAREIMQLFTIGLVKLRMDGSVIKKPNGHPDDTYSIEDIMSMARAWTGFTKPDVRGGQSSGARGEGAGGLDPMSIDIKKRDWFPKTDLTGGFIGDKVALCADQPAKHFLRKGATYILLGGRGWPAYHDDPERWSRNPDFYRLDLDPSSPLYVELCQSDGSECTLPSKITLNANLMYDAAAQAAFSEYAVDTIRTVRMAVGDMVVWYEYRRPPCVQHSFYSDAKTVIKGINGLKQGQIMCENPRLEAATAMCSETGWETSEEEGRIYCHVHGERMTYASSESICRDNGLEQSYPGTIKPVRAGPCGNGITKEFRSWAAAPCNLKVKVAFQSGHVAIVHADPAGVSRTENHVDADTLNFFSVPWEGTGAHPANDNDCISSPSCAVHDTNFCICDIDANDIKVFSTSDGLSIDVLMSSLHVGAADPASHDPGAFANLGSCSIVEVSVYVPTGANCDALTSDTIFAFEFKSKQYFLKNAKSVVSIGGGFSFRNPVGFISLSDPEVRDAYHETDEVLDSLFYDPNHPPYMATNLIQRFGISNPSPGFIERVVTAYVAGKHRRFGSGKYGDLGALVAAIILDDESRSEVLDADQTHGQMREPLVKVIAFFKAMGLHYKSPLRIPTMLSMEEKIGQGSFEHPSVFSFFSPDFSPPGGVQKAGLVAPESMVLRSDNILFLLDAYYTTTKFGIVDCRPNKFSNFESWSHGLPIRCPSVEGDKSLSPAALSFAPQLFSTSADQILDELDVLLTSGRLKGGSNLDFIKSIVEPLMGDASKALRVAQQLVLSTPEFHTTNLPRKQEVERVINGYSSMPKEPYKALVIFYMRGGCDSWNMLVPRDECASGDAFAQYKEVRGNHSLVEEELELITTDGQDCKVFGINNNLGVLAELYKERQAVFFANTGTLSMPTSKHEDWKGESGFRPFAHNTMQQTFYTGDIHEANPGTGLAGRILDMLRVKGYQTSANNVAGGMTMLSGDQKYGNPVFTVSTKPSTKLNNFPTIDNLIGIVKSLNGLGEEGNSFLSEHWSSRLASALFEHKLMQEISAIPEFSINNYPGSDKLAQSFKAVAGYMKSREYRKVNRDIFVVSDKGYDMHNDDQLTEKFQSVNTALSDFVQELKNQGLWESTTIMMGSDFGRSMNANSNSGTDHAWGGNYFLVGGSVNGGKVMGKFPSPVGPDSDHWLPRGRWIPTTPWESVWNGVSQWMGVHSDQDLDWVMPNRESFKAHASHSMCDLFTDKDLFVDGECACINRKTLCGTAAYTVEGDGEEGGEEEYNEPVMPNSAPTASLTGNPSTSPLALTTPPSPAPSVPPTTTPSNGPSTSPKHPPSDTPTTSPVTSPPVSLTVSLTDNPSTSPVATMPTLLTTPPPPGTLAPPSNTPSTSPTRLLSDTPSKSPMALSPGQLTASRTDNPSSSPMAASSTLLATPPSAVPSSSPANPPPAAPFAVPTSSPTASSNEVPSNLSTSEENPNVQTGDIPVEIPVDLPGGDVISKGGTTIERSEINSAITHLARKLLPSLAFFFILTLML